MVLLCFLLDLCTLSPSLLKDLRQCFLQLANLYVVTFGKGERGSEALPNRIGLCYIQKNKVYLSDELKIAYCPQGNFNLRDFHHAVNNLPSDGFRHGSAFLGKPESGCQNPILTKLLAPNGLPSWGGEDVLKKVVLLSSCLVENITSLREILMDAARQCVTVEFILIGEEGIQLKASENVKEFVSSISDLENCLFHQYFWDSWTLCSLVKSWLRELRDDVEEPLHAIFLFKNNLVVSANQISCNLFALSIQIVDGFNPCQTCRCHGLPTDQAVGKMKKSSCPVTNRELVASDFVDNGVKVGEQTVLFLPSFQSYPKLQRISAPITFSVSERTNLTSLSEGLILGAPYVVTPSACHEMEAASDEFDKLEQNIQLFHGLSQALYVLDQGLVCTSYCNIETMMESSLHCFYILQPSEKGPMLLRRLVGSEEVLPIPDSIGSTEYGIPEEMKSSIDACLSNLEIKDYNPLHHERGFHQKLNSLVKESLQFGAIPPKRSEASFKSDSQKLEPAKPGINKVETTEKEAETTTLTQPAQENQTVFITEEWEQLVVNEVGGSYSPTFVYQPRLENSVLSPDKSLDEKMSRILERLEPPRLRKITDTTPYGNHNRPEACTPLKKPLVPFQLNHAKDKDSISSQPLKPNFQRLKRKLR